MKLYLVRHGETDANRILGYGSSMPMHNETVTYQIGQDTNVSLNANGRVHAFEAGGNLPDTIDAFYVSPLLRTKETAEIITEMKNISADKIQFRDELKEYHMGAFEGLSPEMKKEKVGDQSWGSGLLCNYDYTPWGGDSWKTIHDRLESFIAELKSTHKSDEHVVCVTSGGVIRMTYKILFWEQSPGITKHIVVKNGSVHEFIL